MRSENDSWDITTSVGSTALFVAAARALEAQRSEPLAVDLRGQWWQLVYNEQFAPAAQWLSEHGWAAAETSLTDYLDSVGRPVSTADAEADNMIRSITLVSAVKN